jgi:hypothetical protein
MMLNSWTDGHSLESLSTSNLLSLSTVNMLVEIIAYYWWLLLLLLLVVVVIVVVAVAVVVVSFGSNWSIDFVCFKFMGHRLKISQQCHVCDCWPLYRICRHVCNLSEPMFHVPSYSVSILIPVTPSSCVWH